MEWQRMNGNAPNHLIRQIGTQPHGRHGFTLVELLVVIVIISILAAMLLPTLADALEHGRRVVCANNQKQMYLATVSYASDFNDSVYGYTHAISYWNPYITYVGKSEEFVFWAEQYCGASVKHEVGNYPTFLERSILNCPTTQYEKICPHSPIMFSYRPLVSPPTCLVNTGTNAAYAPYDTLPVFRSKLTKAAAPAKGYAKAFFTDNLWINTVPNAVSVQIAFSHGGAADPQGQNVTSGDGRVKWHDFDVTRSAALGHPASRIPMEYWAVAQWYDTKSVMTWWGSGMGRLMLTDPGNLAAGTPGYYFLYVEEASTPEKYRYYCSLWR